MLFLWSGWPCASKRRVGGESIQVSSIRPSAWHPGQVMRTRRDSDRDKGAQNEAQPVSATASDQPRTWKVSKQVASREAGSQAAAGRLRLATDSYAVIFVVRLLESQRTWRELSTLNSAVELTQASPVSCRGPGPSCRSEDQGTQVPRWVVLGVVYGDTRTKRVNTSSLEVSECSGKRGRAEDEGPGRTRQGSKRQHRTLSSAVRVLDRSANQDKWQ